MNKINYFLGTIVICLVLFSFSVNAWGISTSYWSPDNPLILKPGETQIVDMRIQNLGADDGDVTLKAELVRGSEIARIVDEKTDYFVASGTENVKVNVEIKIPADAELGTQYEIAVSFTPKAQDEGGMIQIAGAAVKSFPVRVGSENKIAESPAISTESKNYNTIIMVVVGLIVLAIIAYLIFKKKKRK